MIFYNRLIAIFLFIFVLNVLTPTTIKAQETNENNITVKDAQLNKRLAEIANSVNELKEKVYRSKAKLKLLEETLLLGKITGSKSIIKFTNNVGSIFKLVSGEYYLNGKLIHKFDKEIPQNGEVVIFDGESPPGNNRVSLKLSFTGSDHGTLKLFSYMKDYQFNLESNYDFPVSYGKTTIVNIESLDKGPFKNTLEERLTVRYKTLTEESANIPF